MNNENRQMNHRPKFGLIMEQLLFGIGFGVVGFIAGALLVTVYYQFMGVYLDLFESIMYAVVGGYLGVQTGISFAGYKFLKSNDRLVDFFRFSLQSLLGLILGFGGLYLIIASTGNKIPHGITNVLSIVLPLTAALLAFNFGITKERKELENKGKDIDKPA